MSESKPAVRDKVSVLAWLDWDALAELADRLVLLPAVAFREALWPQLARWLGEHWHGYLHESGRVALSSIASVRALGSRIGQAIRVLEHPYYAEAKLTDRATFLMSGRWAMGKQEPRRPDQRHEMGIWLGNPECDWPEWDRRFVGLLNETGANPTRIAKRLAPLVSRLW